MELRLLVGFLAVAEELHFGRAAHRLQMAQPPLSQQIRQLERELGVQLFERTTRYVRLTSAGQALVIPAQKVIDDVDTAIRAAKAGGQGEYGKVVVGFSGAASHIALPKLARAVRSAYPRIELALRRESFADDSLQDVADGMVDLGFVRLPANRAGLSTRVIERETLVVAIPADHILARDEAINLADLADEPFITFPGTGGSVVRDALVQACAASDFSPRIGQVAPDTYTILALVSAGVGVALLPSSVQHVHNDGMVFRPLTGTPTPLYQALAWRSDNSSATLRRVLEIAEDVLPSPPCED